MSPFSVQIAVLAIAVQANIPVLLWGKPGVGKSEIMKSLFEQLKMSLTIMAGAQHEPQDFSGFPGITETGVRMLPQEWARRLSVDVLGDASAGLFLEELSSVPPATQSAIMRVALEKVVGDLQLSPNVRIVAAANPTDQAANGFTLAAPLANRFLHIPRWDIPVATWVSGMLSGFALGEVPILPDNWESAIPKSRAMFASFIHHQSNLLHQMPVDEDSRGLAWSSPRTLVMASLAYAAANAAGVDTQVKHDLVAGCIGEGVAVSFMSYMNDLDLPSPEDMLNDPSGIKWPTKGDRVFAMMANAIAFAVNVTDTDKGNARVKAYKSAWQVLESAHKAKHTDIAAIHAETLVAKRPNNDFVKEALIFRDMFKLAGITK